MKQKIPHARQTTAVLLAGSVAFLAALATATADLPLKGDLFDPIPDATYSAIFGPAVTTGGEVAVRIGIKGPTGSAINVTNNAVIARYVDGVPELVARSGNVAPTNTGAGTFKSFGDPLISATGDVAFFGTLNSPTATVTAFNDTGVWTDLIGTGPTTGLRNALREGDQALGLAIGQHFSKVNWMVLNADALYIGADTDNSTPTTLATVRSSGVWKWNGDALTKVVAIGDTISLGSPTPTPHIVKTISKPASFGTGNAQSRTVSDDGYLVFLIAFTDLRLEVIRF